MIEWLKNIYDSVKWMHSADGIAQMVQAGGLIALTAIIFAETGLLLGFFLPGDSILISAGVLANPANPNHVPTLAIFEMNIILVIAAVVGDQLGYFLGHKAGDRIWERPDGRFYKRAHLKSAQDFYQRYGGPSLVAARFAPILRTFVPFVAGVARMPYRRFAGWSIAGGVLWISSMLWIGFFLGQTPLANRLDKIIVLVVFVSLMPMFVGIARKAWTARAAKVL